MARASAWVTAPTSVISAMVVSPWRARGGAALGQRGGSSA